jgi:hypothetical protein
MRCTLHDKDNCTRESCRRSRRTAAQDPNTDLTNPISAAHQAVYGGPFYGSGSDSSSSCDTSSGSASSSSDSGSSSSPSSDCGSY